MKAIIASILAVAMSVALASTQASAQTELRMAYTQNTSDTHHLAAERFRDRVAELTNGEITISLHPGGELGKDPDLLEGVRLGTIDIAEAGNPFFTRFEPALNAMDIPFLFQDNDHVYRVIDSETGDKLLASLEKHNMKGLVFMEIGFRNLTNNVRPVRTPDDVEGLKIRTTPNPAHVQAFEILGASPTPMPFPEVYLALETGAVDGQENPLRSIVAQRFYEVQDHLSMTEHAYTVSIVVMNKGKWEGLSPDQQAAIMQAAKEAQAYQREINADASKDAMKVIRDAGVQVVEDVDKAAFKAAVYEATKKSYVDAHGSEITDAIDAAAN